MAYIGYRYYKDDKGVYQLINGKKSYLDKNLNTDNSQLITTRGGTPIYTDTNGQTITYKNGVKTDLGTGEPIKTTNEKQLSIGDLQQQAYAETNKEFQQQLTEVKSSEEYKNITA